jgi:hypothetical protein
MKSRLLVGFAMLLADLGVFVGTAAFLRRSGGFGFSGPWSHFIHSREHWDIAWAALVAAVLLSVAAFLLIEGFGIFRERTKNV